MSTPTIFVVYYSMYGTYKCNVIRRLFEHVVREIIKNLIYKGHVKTLAKEIVKGVQASGANVKLFQIAETLPGEVLSKMHAPPKDESIPVISASQLAEADGTQSLFKNLCKLKN